MTPERPNLESQSGDRPASDQERSGPICALTGMCPGGGPAPAFGFNPANPAADIHPTDKGYAALASLFESASGF